MSELVKFAKAELRAAGLFDSDAEYGGEIAPCVVAMMETFTAYGHSGGSAGQTLALFTKLATHKPLTPLTGEDDEWADPMGDGQTLQNKRCSTVFKDDDKAWIITGEDTVTTITFPYIVQ